jgi:hypothetical protein
MRPTGRDHRGRDQGVSMSRADLLEVEGRSQCSVLLIAGKKACVFHFKLEPDS